MRILVGDLLTQCRNARVRCVPILLLDSNASGLATHEIRRRQVGFAKAEIDASGQGPLKELPYKSRLQTLHAARQPKYLFLRGCRHTRCFSTSSPSSSYVPSRISPTSTL